MRLAKKLFTLFLLVLFLASAVPVRASTDPWASAYTDWPYRVPITISNNLIDVLTDYQVKITLDSTNFDWSHVKSDGGDIRFADSQGNPLGYWIEEWDYTNQQAVIWVKVPSIPSQGSTVIYMYYGNGAATSESNGNAVFEFFDDFSTNKWTISDTNYIWIDTTAKKMYYKSGSAAYAYVTLPTTYDKFALYVKGERTLSDEYGVVAFLLSDAPSALYSENNAIRITLDYNGDKDYISWKIDGTGTAGTNYITEQLNVEYMRVLKYDGSTAILEVNGNSISESVGAISGLDTLEVSVRDKTGQEGYISLIYLTKYANQEPTVTIGAEETNTKVTVAFYFSDSLGNTLNNVNVYANGTLLGVFNNSNSVELEKGAYTFVFEKDGYNNVTKAVDLQNDTEINVVFVPTNPVTITFYFKDDLGNTLNDVDLYIDGKFYGTLDSGDSVMLATQGNYTFLAQKQHYISTQQTLNIQKDTTITLTLDRESYLVYFYAYDYNNTEINGFDIYANGTFLGTFSSGGSTLVKYGTYVFKFEKAGYRSTTLPPILINKTGITVTFTKIPPSNIYTVTFYFYDASNNSILNNVTVLINSEENTLNSGDQLWLSEGNYTLTFSKEGYKSRNLSVEITTDLTMSIYLTPISNETEININQATDMKELIQNITSTVPIEPINPYAKAFLDSGGSFGETVKNAIKGDSLMKLILPQGLIFVLTILVLWQTQSPLAGIGAALIGQAMFIAMLGEKPNLQNSGVTFVLVVFLIAWTLWDLFYNYSRET